jgi:hypothetical protein
MLEIRHKDTRSILLQVEDVFLQGIGYPGGEIEQQSPDSQPIAIKLSGASSCPDEAWTGLSPQGGRRFAQFLRKKTLP